MEEVLHYYPIVLYTLGSILLIVLIILGMKTIRMINKTNIILDDVYNKTRSLNRIFSTIDAVTDTLSSVSDSIVTNVTAIVGRLFHKRRKKESEEEENE